MSEDRGRVVGSGHEPDPSLAVLSAVRTLSSAVAVDLRRSIEEALESDMDPRMLLGDVLIFNSQPLGEAALVAVDRVLAWEAERKPQPVSDFTGALTLAAEGAKVVVWRGDITTLAVDCIVNAANDQGLGCFVPSHRCIDNVLHRAAGPRLREACRGELAQRPDHSLPSGAAPLVTPAFFLPAKWVLHVTGPALRYGTVSPNAKEERLLAACYTGCLEAAMRQGAQSIAFCCLSTGLFNYPAPLAARTALNTVQKWLEAHPNVLDMVLFDVFTAKDDAIYHQLAPQVFPVLLAERTIVDFSSANVQKASEWIREAEAVLVCAGAGMSVKQGEMVYVNPADFARFYPDFRLTRDWGYTTAYECMGLFEDGRVTDQYRWGFWATHAMNQRYRFDPNAGYAALRQLIGPRDYFVYTSNADGCFVRAGFNADQVYTPQGDWQWYQCAKPCDAQAFWQSKSMLDRAAQVLTKDGSLPSKEVPKCARCKGPCLPNVRGGDWFLETPHESAKLRYRSWLKHLHSEGKKVAIVEVGAGFNTPTVTRYPMEALARRLPGACLIRINPTEAEVPADLPKAVSIAEGWEALLKLLPLQQPIEAVQISVGS